MSNWNAGKPPENYHHTPPSLSSLPDEIVLRCLTLVPRSYHLNISWVSKHLRALVRSPELNKLRSILHKSSLHVCLEEEEDECDDDSFFQWFTLRPIEETETTTEYELVPNPKPFPSHPNYEPSTVVVGSKIFFIGGGSTEPSTDLWILDTQSGTMTQGPSMSVSRVGRDAAVGVIDGKIYVIGGGGGFNEEIPQVEVFDPKSETWELAGAENVRKIPRCSASVEGKVIIVENPREREGGRFVQMVSERLSEGGRKERLVEIVDRVCVVEDVLFALFEKSGLMWFDTEHNVWRRLVGRDGKEMFIFHADAMAEYDGKLVVLYMWGESKVGDTFTKSVRCKLVSLHRTGDRICGEIDWSGVVGTVPVWFRFLHCLAVSGLLRASWLLARKDV